MTYYIQHHGVAGQKWGVRRYQSPDGGLTNAGKKRYGSYDEKYQKKLLKEDAKSETVLRKKYGSEADKLYEVQSKIDKEYSAMYGIGNKEKKAANDYYVKNSISKDQFDTAMTAHKNERAAVQKKIDSLVNDGNEFSTKFGNAVIDKGGNILIGNRAISSDHWL